MHSLSSLFHMFTLNVFEKPAMSLFRFVFFRLNILNYLFNHVTFFLGSYHTGLRLLDVLAG